MKVTQVRLSKLLVLMRDINQKSSNTDKQIAIALRRSVWLNYLLTFSTISASGLSFYALTALLGTKPAQANTNEQAANLLAQTAATEFAIDDAESKLTQSPAAQTAESPTLGSVAKLPVFTAQNLSPTSEFKFMPTAVIPVLQANDSNLTEKQVVEVDIPPRPEARGFLDASQQLATEGSPRVAPSLRLKSGDASSKTASIVAESRASSTGFSTQNLDQSTTVLPNFVPSATVVTPTLPALEQNTPSQIAVGDQHTTVKPGFVPPQQVKSIKDNGYDQLARENKPAAFELTHTELPSPHFPLSPTKSVLFDGRQEKVGDVTANSKQNTVPSSVASSPQPAPNPFPTAVLPTPQPAPNPIEKAVPPTSQLAQTSVATAVESTVYKSPGSAALLGGTLQAQSSRENTQQPAPTLQNTPQRNDALAPSLVFQGVYLYQGDSSARARLTGIYPISPNALVGGTAEIGTGPDFSDPQAGSFRINELYFTGNLPSLPNLRLTAGLVDLTSYFDRNSFAKDAATHFFNPVFQTNPALSATGIASRPAVLLNWNITDNIEAKAAGFSSAESILDFNLDAFAGELGFRFGNGIIRATYATDRDVDRNGFKEIYGIQRNPGEFGPRSSDRESSYGINTEYFIPELKMGLFGRYGRYENTSIGRGGDTYSLGLNFLDLFIRDDRLGFGYGRNLSNDELRRQTGAKVPDVWELFYDFRISPILRAAVSLQERDQFTDTVFGFRIKTEFDVTSLLGRVFR